SPLHARLGLRLSRGLSLKLLAVRRLIVVRALLIALRDGQRLLFLNLLELVDVDFRFLGQNILDVCNLAGLISEQFLLDDVQITEDRRPSEVLSTPGAKTRPPSA